MHFGLGWGQYNGSEDKIRNPFTYISNKFIERNDLISDQGGQVNFGKYFSNKDVSPFYGFSYKLNNKLLLKLEKDTTYSDVDYIKYKERKNDYSIGFNYELNNNIFIGASFERGSNFSFKFVYRNNPKNNKEI